MRLGGNGYPWSFSARDSTYFVIENVAYVAVASSSVDSSALQPGSVFVYKFISSNSASGGDMTLLQVPFFIVRAHATS